MKKQWLSMDALQKARRKAQEWLSARDHDDTSNKLSLVQGFIQLPASRRSSKGNVLYAGAHRLSLGRVEYYA